MMRINTLSILSILIVSSQATRGLKGLSRILEDTWNDDNANYTYHFEVESSARSEAEPTSSSISSSSMNVTHIQEMIVNRAQKYKEVVESKAWEFYQSSPSEWTESQWDFVLMLFGGLLLLSCCCLSAACAYCCIYRREDKDGPSSKHEDRYAKLMWYNRLKRHRSRYRKERYKHEDTDTIESQPTFDSGGSISAVSSFETFGTTTKNDKKESLLKKSGKKKKSKETKGSYESPKNKRQDTTELSLGSILSFEMENEGTDTPHKSIGRSRTRVEC